MKTSEGQKTHKKDSIPSVTSQQVKKKKKKRNVSLSSGLSVSGSLLTKPKALPYVTFEPRFCKFHNPTFHRSPFVTCALSLRALPECRA